MVLNIKNLFKKVCMLSAAATMAVGLGASFAEAGTPGAGTTGVEVGSVDISKAGSTDSLVLTVTIPLADTLTFNGTAQQLILASKTANNETTTLNVTSSLETSNFQFYGTNSNVDLWLRVADVTDGTAATAAAGDWIQYTGESSLTNSKLKRTNVGTYKVYYYIDGKNNYNDVGASG